MLSLKAKIRKETGKQVEKLRKKGQIPAVLYGPKIENLSLEIGLKEFTKAFQEVGESSLVKLEVGDKNFLVLVHALEIDALSQKPIHIDFYQPKLDEEITVSVPIVFEGESPAVKGLGGTLVKNIHQVEVRAFPQNLPHEIKVNVGKLEKFGDNILIKDLVLPEGVKVLRGRKILSFWLPSRRKWKKNWLSRSRKRWRKLKKWKKRNLLPKKLLRPRKQRKKKGQKRQKRQNNVCFLSNF